MQLPEEGVEPAFGKPHPLESAVARQLDSIDLDDGEDWGLEEVRATVAEGTVSTATDSTQQSAGVVGGRLFNGESVGGGGRERHTAVDGESCVVCGCNKLWVRVIQCT